MGNACVCTQYNDAQDDKTEELLSMHMNVDDDDEKRIAIVDASELSVDDNLKEKAIRDESGYNVIPMSPAPVLSLTLDLSYDLWTDDMRKHFLSTLAKELIVNVHELTIIASSRGSINVSVLINAVKTQYHSIPITCAYIQDKSSSFSSSMSKFAIKSTQIKNWCDNALPDHSQKLKATAGAESPSAPLTDQPSQWILAQTECLRSKLDSALRELDDEYTVSALCILHNEDSLLKFTQHADIAQSRLLFHGARLKDLCSIYETGLKSCHRGAHGAIYGRGSYLTSKPLHAINYMMCYKDGKTRNEEYTLVAAFVNCGRVKEIVDMAYSDMAIESPFDAHHIGAVASTSDERHLGYTKKFIRDHTGEEYEGAMADEYAVTDATRILPRFYITLRKVQKDCFAYFTGLVVGDTFKENHISVVYKVDKCSECVGEGEYPRNRDAFPKAVGTTFDGIALNETTRIIIWEKENFEGKILLDRQGPAIINNMTWKNDSRYAPEMSRTFVDAELQSTFPQHRRYWSESDMHPWSYGSLKVTRAV